jgi:hypothetical protein
MEFNCWSILDRVGGKAFYYTWLFQQEQSRQNEDNVSDIFSAVRAHIFARMAEPVFVYPHWFWRGATFDLNFLVKKMTY